MNVKDLEMSSGRTYAKGIHQTLSFLAFFLFSFCLSLIILTWIKPFFFVVEFKPPVIKPLIVSIKDLFAKRARDDKSTETHSSKAPSLLSPVSSHVSKKVRIDPPVTATDPEDIAPLAIRKYEMAADPTTFAHLLNNMLLPQSMEALSAKPVSAILNDAAGYSFYTLQAIMVAREVHEYETKKFKDLEEEHKNCVGKIREAEELALSNLKALKDIQDELEDFTFKVQSMDHRGEWSSWNIPETVRIYNEAFPDDAFPMNEFAGMNYNEAKSPKDDVQEDK
ncbi:uncharacterized protein LOC141690576 [Apium graveolens]|uniref:uncharacterized protein LOC141690576 n=1 Tax=Apium graveolens TaxID=4045 RepID=UPI003D798681